MENKIRKAIREQIKNLKEDYKPSHRAYNVIDKSNNDKIVAKELSRDKALELAKTNKDYMISATDRLAEKGMSPEEWADAKEKERLNQHPEKDTINKIKQMMDKEKDEEQEEYDKGWYGESLRETATQLGYLKEHYKGYKTDNTLNPWNRPEFNQDENNAYRYFNDLFFDGNFENPNELLRDLEEFHMIEKEEAKRILSQYFNDLMKTVEKEVTDTTEKQTFKNSMIKRGFKGYLKEVDGMEGVDEQGLDQIERGINQITDGGRQSARVSDRGDKIRVMFRYMRGEFDGETWEAILEYLSDNMGYKILDQSNYYEANYDREEPAEAVPTIYLQK